MNAASRPGSHRRHLGRGVVRDPADGSELRLSRGSALDAVMASAAIPGVFPPVRWNGRQLMDGGVSNNVPISHALELGADEVFVLPTGFPCSLQEPPGGPGDAPARDDAPTQQRLVREIDVLRDSAKLIVLPPPCPLGVQPIDFGSAGDLIERGRAGSRAFLDGAEAGRLPFSMSGERLRPHAHAPG
jgi:NTE family protein